MNVPICSEAIVIAARSLVECQPTKRGCVVTTSCLYPDGSAVQVTIKETPEGFYVTDAGRALVQVRSSGHQSDKPGFHIARAAHAMGVEYARGMVYLRSIEVDTLDTAIALVASASLHGVVRTFAHYHVPNEQNFRFAFDSYIRQTFGDKFKKSFVDGAHNSHTLDYVYIEDKVVIADPIQPDRMSVDRAFSVHSDILRSDQKPHLQLLVFDEEDAWKPGDLAHLKSIGVPVMEYEEAQEYLPEVVPLVAVG